MAVEGGMPAICWEVGYSAWELFALETGSVLLYPGIGVGESVCMYVLYVCMYVCV